VCVDWPFQFWNFGDQCRIHQRFEGPNLVNERVYVISDVVLDEGRVHKRICIHNVGESEKLVATTLWWPAI